MRLDRIIRNSGCTITVGDAFVEIDAVCNDSRKVTRGSAFVAVKGYATDGHDYISIAIGKGAKVEDSVVMPGVVIEPGAIVRHAILVAGPGWGHFDQGRIFEICLGHDGSQLL